MAIRVVLFLTLFTGLSVADSKGNLALGATAVQSSIFGGAGAQRAVDGNRDSDFTHGSCTHTNADLGSWWRVDLGQVYDVSRVSITNRGDGSTERINGAQIRIGNSLGNNGNNNELAATVVSIPPGETKTFDFKPINGRYVNILIPGRNEYLTLCEVEVFAEKYRPTYNCFPRNLAVGAAAVQSSIFGGAGAQRAVDGNRDSDFTHGSCTHTNADLGSWWRVDLGQVYEVTRVNITNRGDGSTERINGAQIRIGNSLENNGNNNELAATVVSIPPGVTKTFDFKPINGRYVNIVIPGRNEFLHLCEVEVFAEKYTSMYSCFPRNLAVGAAAVQSSIFGGAGAQRAVDGNRDSDFTHGSCTHTNADLGSWWRVDLGQVYEVTRVNITNRGDGSTERINGAQIRIGNSLENNGNNNELAATVVSIPPGVTKSFEFKPINGRYVNIVIPGRNEFLHLCEVEVFAEKYTSMYTCFPRNLAVGAAAVQSSIFGGAGAQRAVDGNRDSDFTHGSCTHTNADLGSWWRVDLGQVYEVTRVNITNRGDGSTERINGAQIRIGNSLENNGNNNELAATVVSIPPGVTKTFDFKPINGRYVNIVIPGRNEFLHLCEVEVFAEKYTSMYSCFPRNLALGATAVQSSIFGGAGAQRAVDGNRDSDFTHGTCTHTNADLGSWWRVDLGQVYKVSRVSITNRGDGSTERINGAQIRIGNSLENNGNNNQLAATVESIPAGETKPFEFKPIKGRYVNIVIPGRNEFLHLCEVEVFGEKYTPTYICAPRNLALGTTAVQSSTYDQAGAQRAVDGNRNSIFSLGSCSHTDGDRDPWWRVDLGEIYEVTRVSIINRGDCCAERINGAQIRIGNSLDNNGNNNELAATVVSMSLGDTKTFEFKPINGRYVNIIIPGRNEYLTLCEVEVFAD